MKQGVKDLATPATNSLDKFLDNEIIESALKSPESLTNFGLDDLDFLTNHNEKWDDYSIKANKDAYEDFLEYERKLNSFDANSLERSAKLNLMVAQFSAENQKRQFESFEYHQGPFYLIAGNCPLARDAATLSSAVWRCPRAVAFGINTGATSPGVSADCSRQGEGGDRRALGIVSALSAFGADYRR